MKIEFAARVDQGIRGGNDDRVLIDGKILDCSAASGTLDIPAVAVVCDGCGGYYGGNIAAQTVLERIAEETPGTLLDEKYLSVVLDDCEKAIALQKEKQPQYSSMCSTVAGCVFGKESTVFFHSGDSRIYRIDKWGVSRMTRDHSAVQELIDRGEISEEDAAVYPDRNVITRCMGGNGTPPDIYVSHVPVAPGEIYVLCSDGFWESVGDTELTDVLESGNPIERMADILVRLALDHGSEDNISVCICSVVSAED